MLYPLGTFVLGLWGIGNTSLGWFYLLNFVLPCRVFLKCSWICQIFFNGFSILYHTQKDLHSHTFFRHFFDFIPSHKPLLHLKFSLVWSGEMGIQLYLFSRWLPNCPSNSCWIIHLFQHWFEVLSLSTVNSYMCLCLFLNILFHLQELLSIMCQRNFFSLVSGWQSVKRLPYVRALGWPY